MSAGFLFSLNSSDTSASTLEIVSDCVNRGMYATLVNSRWNPAVVSTLGDFIAMKPGDNVTSSANEQCLALAKLSMSSIQAMPPLNCLKAQHRQNTSQINSPMLITLIRQKIKLRDGQLFFDHRPTSL